MALHSQHSTRIEQPGAELMVPLTRFWERYGKIASGVLAGLVVVGVAGFFSLRARAATEEAAAGKLAEASLYYWQGDYQRSLQLSRDIATQYGSTPSGHEAHRQAADAAYWGGDFKTAIAEYRRYLATNPKGMLGDAARRSLAYALESDRQFGDAVKEYDALVGRMDRASSAEFLLAGARCLVAARQIPAAIERLQRLVNDYGETDYANHGRLEISELQTLQSGTPHP